MRPREKSEMSLPSAIDTVVIGAGQAGLTMSYHLSKAGRDHIVLDRHARPGGGWQDRWDAFRLVTPNWTASFPDAPYDGTDPDGFMPRDEVVARVAGFAEQSRAPLALGTEVRRVMPHDDGWTVESADARIRARNVVIATGGFHEPNLPPIAGELPARITQLHSHAYRRESDLPPGGVLVVGSGQSGVQIAEELADAGRRVHLSVGTAGRIPRRYRGRDIFRWLHAIVTTGPAHGISMPTVETLPDPRARMAANPHLSGHGGGHDTNLREFAATGRMTLLGRIAGVTGERLDLADDLPAKLAFADAFFEERFQPLIEGLIDAAGLDAPPDDREPFFHDPPVPRTLDLAREGISTVLWTTGYRRDYSWIDAPISDEFGFPRQVRGVAAFPGLFFIGSLWQHSQASATLFGVGGDARELARRMDLTAAEG
jgi:putative flavoprotein involved in K+ transport